MDKRLLTDTSGMVKMSLEESKSGRMKMRGEFGKADVPTENRRIYPRNVWAKEIDKIQESIKAGKVFGHIEHPANGKTDLAKVSHMLTGIWMEPDGRIIGEAVILNNDHGRQLKSILEAGGAIGVSSRGMGSTSTNKDGYEVVGEDFSYITHDCVADPAVRTSYPTFVEEGAVKVANIEETTMQVEEKNIVENYSKEQVDEMIKASTEAVVESVKAEYEAKLLESAKENKEATPVVVENKEEPSAEQVTEPVIKTEVEITPDVTPHVTESKKDDEIASLKTQIESMTKKFAKLEEDVIDALNGAKRLAIQLEYEREANDFGDIVLFRKMMGESKNYENSGELRKAVLVVKATLAESKRQERMATAKAKRIEESFKNKVSKLEAEVSSKNKSLEESLVKEKEEMAKIYCESRLSGNPNAPKLRRLLEGVTEKNKIDEIISQYVVATPNAELYNSIRSRFEGLKNTTLVESQLGNNAKGDETKVESVDQEIQAILS